jgi:hypothetical protein
MAAGTVRLMLQKKRTSPFGILIGGRTVIRKRVLQNQLRMAQFSGFPLPTT